MKHSRLTLGLVLATLILLTGCGAPASDSNSASTGPASGLCQPLETINQTLTQLSDIGDNTTVGEVKAAQQKLASALNALGALPGSRGDAYNSLKSVSDQLAAAVQGQPDSATVGQIGLKVQGLKDKVAQAQGATTKLASTLHCRM
jgi:hypothetical protein